MDQLPSGSNYDQIWTRYICTSSRSSWFCLQNIIKLPIGKMNIEHHGSYSILHCFRCTANRTGAAAYRFGCLVFQQHKTLHVPSLIILDSPTLSLTSIVVNKKMYLSSNLWSFTLILPYCLEGIVVHHLLLSYLGPLTPINILHKFQLY